jgi:hypothetical protein
MAFGLEIYNPSGVKMLSVTEALTKYVGVISLGQNANNGSQVFANLAGGRPFAEVLRTSTDPGLWIVPQISFSGTTVYWTFDSSGTSGRAACKIVIGTY